MAPKPSKADKKIAYDSMLCSLLDEYGQILIVAADNVIYPNGEPSSSPCSSCARERLTLRRPQESPRVPAT